MRQFKVLVGDTVRPFEIRVPAIGVETYLAPVKLTSLEGNDFGFDLEVEVAQTGTAGYTGFLVNVVETSVGSGERIPFNVKVGGVSVASVDNAGGLTCKAFTSNGIDDCSPENAVVIESGERLRFSGITPDSDCGLVGAESEKGNVWMSGGSDWNEGAMIGLHGSLNIAPSVALFRSEGFETMRIDSTGNVGIGNTPSGTYKLEVTGNVSLEDLTSTGGVVVLSNLPTSDPTNAGQLWNDSNTLKISAG